MCISKLRPPMAFSIANLLKKQATETEPSATNRVDNGQNIRTSTAIAPFAFPWMADGQDAPRALDINDHISGSSAAPGMVPVPALASQLPSLADLQLLFGGGGPKAHYRRNRRSGADRKPRQAYSTKQLEKLEDEFKKDKYLSVSKRVELSKSLNLSETQIKTWFQNRRTKWKKQVTASLRQFYRHGLYSQYAAVAAAANPTCFFPVMASAPSLYDPLSGVAPEQQASTSAMTSNASWSMSNNAFLGFQGMEYSSANSSAGSTEHKIAALGKSDSPSSSDESSIMAD